MNLNWMANLAWEHRHPQLLAGLRFAGGVFLLAPAAILSGYNTDLWLSAVLLALAALNFHTAYRLPQTISAMNAARDAT